MNTKLKILSRAQSNELFMAFNHKKGKKWQNIHGDAPCKELKELLVEIKLDGRLVSIIDFIVINNERFWFLASKSNYKSVDEEEW